MSTQRLAIVDPEKCQPKRCQQECRKSCPVNGSGKKCIEVDSLARISEVLCTGCNICTKKCPFQAIKIINLPQLGQREIMHRYGPNSFQLHRLPLLKKGQILGLIGTNGIGKSTALKILCGNIIPNLGRLKDPPTTDEIISHFRGSELMTHFQKLYSQEITCAVKAQYVDHLPKIIQGSVGSYLQAMVGWESIANDLSLTHLLERTIEQLSGGELQRFAIAICCLKPVQVRMFDEPSSYLDVLQRIQMARVIKKQSNSDNSTLVVEHDLSILDYISDQVACLYGVPGAYGVITVPYSVREGINIYLEGFIPTENLRFRDQPLSFKIQIDEDLLPMTGPVQYQYDDDNLQKGNFQLQITGGSFCQSEMLVILGQNGTGKTSFLNYLYKNLGLVMSCKPQLISPKFQGTVRELLHLKIPHILTDSVFRTDVFKPLEVENLYDSQVQTLSGGELQKVAITLALGKTADVYLLDECSAYLDVLQRVQVSKAIKRYLMHTKKSAFIVEHDMIMATYLADKVMVMTGEPGVRGLVGVPENLITGMNRFLKGLEITFRRDPTNYRFRVNQMGSLKDREQKEAGNYFISE